MTRTSAVQLKSAAFLAACWAVLSPQPAMAETAPTGSSLSLLQKKCESAGLSASESKTLSAQAGKLEEEGLTDKTLVDLMDQSLSLGKGPAVQKSLDRVGFLLGQGLDPEEAGQVALKEVEATQKDQEKTLDQEMEKTLASGLPDHTATSKPVVLTQKELAEKLEQKREEWEERLEDQKRLEAIENDHLEQHK